MRRASLRSGERRRRSPVSGPDATRGMAPASRVRRIARLSGFQRALLALAFGAAIAFCFALGWILIGRAFSPRAIVATGFFALAGFLAAVRH